MDDAVVSVLAFVVNLLGPTFFAVVIGAIIVRVIVSFFRRRPQGAKDAVAPIFSSGAVESGLYGFRPALEEPLLGRTEWSATGEPLPTDESE